MTNWINILNRFSFDAPENGCEAVRVRTNSGELDDSPDKGSFVGEYIIWKFVF